MLLLLIVDVGDVVVVAVGVINDAVVAVVVD